MYIKRKITAHLTKVLQQFPIVSVTGPRQSGKTTLLKTEFPNYKYFNLERIDFRNIIKADPIGFINNAGTKVIFDEAQNLPELFSYIQVISDDRDTPGQFILSGSQSFLLNEKISQSLAGRVNINHLYPFDITEFDVFKNQNLSEVILKGFYPRIYNAGIEPQNFYPSYLQTYIERDIRTLKSIENLNTFTRFLGLCAGRIGQILNISSMANDAGISVNTARSWLSLLETSFVIYLLKPYYNNFNKRLIKAPKLYFYDTGVASSLLNILEPGSLITHYAYGALFENLVISELIKDLSHKGRQPPVYYWRESNGIEIDCILEKEAGKLMLIECKGGETFNNDYLKNLIRFPESQKSEKVVIYAGRNSMKIKDINIKSIYDLPSLLDDVHSLQG